MRKCNKCKRWTRAADGSQEHRCPPRWFVAEMSAQDDEDEYLAVHADDPEEAAEMFARAWWSDEAPMDGEALAVSVRLRDGSLASYTVTASWRIDYTVDRGRPS